MSAGGVLERLAALERTVDSLQDQVGGSEAITPNYLTINPITGLVGAVFTGHVHAQGLDLDAGTGSTPPTEDRTRWLRTTDGAVVADLTAFSNAGLEALRLDANAAAAGDNSNAMLGAVDDQGTRQALLAADQANRGASGSVQAQFGTVRAVLINVSGAASYPQLPPSGGSPSALRTQALSGLITAAGGISGTSTGGFTVTKGAAGIYTINWTQAFKDTGYGIVVTLGPTLANPSWRNANRAAGSIDVNTYNNAGALTDSQFTFVAVGVY